MRLTSIDSDDGILRRVFRTAIFGVPLVYILGWPGLIVFVVPPIFSLGMDRASRPGNVAARPFSFCLPGFRESLRTRYFRAAALMGLGASGFLLAIALYARFQHASLMTTDPATVCLRMAAAFLVGMVIAFAMGTLRFVLSRLAWSVVMLLSIPLFLVAVVAVPAFVEYWVVGIPLCTVACVFVWLRLGDMRQVKRGHRMILEDALERRAQAGVTRTVAPWVDSLFQGRIERRRQLGPATYIWGSLYRAFGLVFSYWMWLPASIVVGAFVLGFAGDEFVKMAFVALGLVALRIHLPVVFDGMLSPMGRRERFYATLAVGIAASLLVVVAAGLVTVCTWVFSLFLSSREHSAYAGIAPESIWLSGSLVPWMLGWRLLRHRRPKVASVVLVAVLASLGVMWFLYVGEIPRLRSAGTVLLVAASVSGWPFFLVVLRDVCAGASLIDPQSCGADTE